MTTVIVNRPGSAVDRLGRAAAGLGRRRDRERVLRRDRRAPARGADDAGPRARRAGGREGVGRSRRLRGMCVPRSRSSAGHGDGRAAGREHPPGAPVVRAAAVLAALCALTFAASAGASELRPTLNELEHEVMCPTYHTPSTSPTRRSWTASAPSSASGSPRATRRARSSSGSSPSSARRCWRRRRGAASACSHGRSRSFAIVLGALAVGAVVVLARRRHGSSGGDEEPPLDRDLERRLDAELAELAAFDP